MDGWTDEYQAKILSLTYRATGSHWNLYSLSRRGMWTSSAREVFCCGNYTLSGSNKKLATAKPVRKLPRLRRAAWSGVQEGQIGAGGGPKNLETSPLASRAPRRGSHARCQRDSENVDGEIPRGKASVQEWFHGTSRDSAVRGSGRVLTLPSTVSPSEPQDRYGWDRN